MLKNLLNIKDENLLEIAESDITYIKLLDLDNHFIEEDVNQVISKLHNIQWATLNIQETAEYFAKLIARLWQIHPFRAGNTRTIITFATQFSGIYVFK